MAHPIANQFKNGTFEKPTLKKSEFYQGGFLAMQKRFCCALRPFPGACDEFRTRAEGLEQFDSIAIMWEYIKVE